MPEKVPEKGSLRRFCHSAAGGARSEKITAKPREECTDFCENPVRFSRVVDDVADDRFFVHRRDGVAQLCKTTVPVHKVRNHRARA